MDTSQRYLALDVPTDLSPIETFSLNMIYSIACHVIPNSAKRQDARNLWQSSGKQARYQANCLKYRHLASKFYDKAMDHVEAATLEPTLDTLRAVLLMAINSLFDPKAGNIGQQIALAARIAYSLEAKTEQEGAPPGGSVEMLRHMHMTIFSIENEIASTLDRPATFPEPVGPPLLSPLPRASTSLLTLILLSHRPGLSASTSPSQQNTCVRFSDCNTGSATATGPPKRTRGNCSRDWTRRASFSP